MTIQSLLTKYLLQTESDSRTFVKPFQINGSIKVCAVKWTLVNFYTRYCVEWWA